MIGLSCSFKMATTLLFRLKTTDVKTPPAEVKKILDGQFFRRWSDTQLNCTEYDSIFIPGFLYLALKGVAAPWAVSMAVSGQLWYFIARVLTGHPHEGGPKIFPPPYVPGALARYAAIPLMALAIYQSL